MASTRVTWQYPLEKKPKPNRQHGRHVLNRYEDGMEKCIGCELCAGVCPADCIYVRGADNPPGDPVSPGERYGFVYEINYLRCIHCDMCVEACPTEAITETKLFEFSFTNRADAIYTKKELLVGDDGRPKHMPWEDWRQGDDLFTSAWMRATSPSGNAAYEGRVQWSGELGYGIRAPEGGQSGLRDDAATGIKEIRDVFSDHLDDWERNDDQRGPVGVRNRLKAHIALRKASIKIPGSQAQAAGGVAVIHALPVLATATLVDRITFGIGATIIILGAIGVVISRNPVALGPDAGDDPVRGGRALRRERANFLAAVQVIVYAGAIVVLFLFVIMFLGVDREENLAEEPLPRRGRWPSPWWCWGWPVCSSWPSGPTGRRGRRRWPGPAQGQKGGDVAAIGRSRLHHLSVPLRNHRRPARHRRGRGRGPRPATDAAVGGRRERRRR